MNNPALLRRLAMAALITAIVTGAFSLYHMFTQDPGNWTLSIISVTAMAIGLGLDRRAGKLDDRNSNAG